MNNFPISLNLKNRKILIIGAGKIATNKINKLLDFTNDIVVLAPKISEEIKELDIKIIEKEYEKKDIEGFNIVIACIDNINLQKEIYQHTRETNVLYNCSDILELCDFTFSSILKKDDLIISISTSGTSPSFSKELKSYLESIIPSSVGSFLKEMKTLRTTLPKGKSRMEMLKKRSKSFIQSWK
ncbi:MAG: precorrin-2 dehydrogenase/sirohydrochlorin ferrochelatase family protein [Arcobacter sp.]|uniref:precorrin-2 dehydrogenase/sirohydrochlorin ferrochelatase family protein n=1 Tax=Arcobacter sp. TaxID=1872629 RepID=UPI003B00A8D7